MGFIPSYRPRQALVLRSWAGLCTSGPDCEVTPLVCAISATARVLVHICPPHCIDKLSPAYHIFNETKLFSVSPLLVFGVPII